MDHPACPRRLRHHRGIREGERAARGEPGAVQRFPGRRADLGPGSTGRRRRASGSSSCRWSRARRRCSRCCSRADVLLTCTPEGDSRLPRGGMDLVVRKRGRARLVSAPESLVAPTIHESIAVPLIERPSHFKLRALGLSALWLADVYLEGDYKLLETRTRTPCLIGGWCRESHFRNVDGCESGFRNTCSGVHAPEQASASDVSTTLTTSVDVPGQIPLHRRRDRGHQGLDLARRHRLELRDVPHQPHPDQLGGAE